MKVKVFNLIILDESGSMVSIFTPNTKKTKQVLNTKRITRIFYPN
jgi:hypothetical protein